MNRIATNAIALVLLSVGLALFKDPKIGLTHTPQPHTPKHFFYANPVQHNLGVSQSYPDEQWFFFLSFVACTGFLRHRVLLRNLLGHTLGAVQDVGDFPLIASQKIS